MSWFTSASIRILLILAALAFSKTVEAVPEGNPCVPQAHPAFGVWIWLNNAAWVPLHGFDRTVLATGDLDGNGLADIIINFPGSGLWVRFNNATWVHLHSSNVTRMATGNIDGDAGRRADLIVNFPGFGVWAWLNHGGYIQLHTLDPENLVSADFDGL